MRVQISARRCEVPQSIRDRAESRLGKLSKYEPRISSAEVVFEVEKHVKRVEAVVSVDRDEPVVAKGEAAEFPEALDRMMDRLGRILKKRRSLKKEHHGPGLADAALPSD